jgi:hypothetical protein
MADKYILHLGCHRGTITSRDSTRIECASEAAARKRVAESEAFYRSVGYVVWFANLEMPDGTKKSLHAGTSVY